MNDVSMQHIIRDILRLAIYAPSGDNLQPWKFIVQGNTLFVCSVPERDQTLYNFAQRGSFVAHGALIENIAIVSPHFGYRAVIELFPLLEDPQCTAKVMFEKTGSTDNELLNFIKERTTNRKPHAKKILDAQVKEKLLECQKYADGATLILVEDHEKLKELGSALSLQDQLLLENFSIHEFIFQHIRWTEKEEHEKKSGLYFATLGLAGPPKIMFKAFQFWKIASLLAAIGFSKIIGIQMAKLYSESGAIGAIVIPGSTPKDFVNAGRLLQKVWLTCTRLGLAFQPITGIMFLGQMLSDTKEHKEIPHNQAIRIYDAWGEISTIFDTRNKTFGMIFRIGYAPEVDARSSRLEPEIRYE